MPYKSLDIVCIVCYNNNCKRDGPQGGKVEQMEKMDLYVLICDRAEKYGYDGDRMTLMMDLQSADNAFQLRLEELLNADAFDFIHDLHGIINNIDRSVYPATNFGLFVPRFAGHKEV